MAEYIEREAALKSVCYDCSLNENNPFCGIACADYERIKSIPAADVVPVVRCRVCQNSYEWTNADRDTYRYCGYLRDRWNHDYDRMVDDDDFCKWGIEQEGSNG